MYLAINILGLIVFLAVGWVFSRDRASIDWTSVGFMVAINLAVAWLLTSFQWGRDAVKAAADGFAQLVAISFKGISFAIGNWVGANGVDPAPVNFIVSALLPILLIVPLFDILTYIGFLPWVITWIGRGLSFITRRPKFETFFAVEMMFLGNTEALAISKTQLRRMKAGRNVTLAMMSMSCITAAIVGAYIQMVPGEYVITAIPLNCINALIISHMLYPVAVSAQEDVIHAADEDKDVFAGLNAKEREAKEQAIAAYQALPWHRKLYRRDPSTAPKEPFFSFLGDSILSAGRLVLIIAANVIAFVALAALIDKLLGMIWNQLSLESILGTIMYPFAWLLGLDPTTSWDCSQLMGLKLVTNEFVVMGKISGGIAQFPEHYKAVLTVFLTSFANFSTLGMIIGCFKGMVSKEKNDAISKQVGRMLISGILVSLLSAGMVGLFVH
ncbi:nucleoside transporter [Bifidobacterium sp. 64T4]|uniref:NupC/NupG family nucleoside CNT transporter n=1 Tax=Bifidobacterium pongonis TaxID=2834432 RepID=UPI001C55C608|nr:nucleoside transporter C-terminal domain-containing protein [Bifidobacterium pongonis]MBW3094784.1 nucleoside transporter [Bifidobacterium pongonis]